MRIESLVRITGGVLLNSPSVDSINDIKISSKKIQRENLFIDVNNNEEEINEAIENGAYCILSTTIPHIKDNEIAWINVDCLNDAIIKLSRFYASNKNFKFIALSFIQYKLAKCIQINKKARVLSQDIAEALTQIIHAQDNELFLVLNSEFIVDVDPSITLPKNKIYPQQIHKSGIFYSSFIYNDKFFNNIKLSPFFIPYLCSLIEYFDKLDIDYKIENFNNLEHFYPQFINNKLEKKDFGTTNKALIFENDFELFKQELNFLETQLDISKLVVLIPNKTNFTCKVTKMMYNNFFEIKNLQDKNFRYALIFGDIKNFEESLKMTTHTQMSLF